MLCNSNRADGSEAPSVRAGRFTERLEAKIEDQGESLRTDIPDILPMAKARGFLFHVTAVVARTLTTTLGDTKPHSDFSSGIEF